MQKITISYYFVTKIFLWYPDDLEIPFPKNINIEPFPFQLCINIMHRTSSWKILKLTPHTNVVIIFESHKIWHLCIVLAAWSIAYFALYLCF